MNGRDNGSVEIPVQPPVLAFHAGSIFPRYHKGGCCHRQRHGRLEKILRHFRAATAAGAKSEWSIRITKMRRIRQNSSRQMLYSRRYLQYLLQPAHTGCLPQERLRLADSIKDPRKFKCKVGTLPKIIKRIIFRFAFAWMPG